MYMQVAFWWHPPAVGSRQLFMAEQSLPSPVHPAWQAHVCSPGPIWMHSAWGDAEASGFRCKACLSNSHATIGERAWNCSENYDSSFCKCFCPNLPCCLLFCGVRLCAKNMYLHWYCSHLGLKQHKDQLCCRSCHLPGSQVCKHSYRDKRRREALNIIAQL